MFAIKIDSICLPISAQETKCSYNVINFATGGQH